jgi:serine/threonine protein kinase
MYAIKKVPVGDDHPRLELVLQEVKALERLHHPNIIAYKHTWLERTQPADFGPSNVPTLFILTEYANSGNLHDFIFHNKNRYGKLFPNVANSFYKGKSQRKVLSVQRGKMVDRLCIVS